MKIVQSKETEALRNHLHKGFGEHAIATIGFNGYAEAPVSFEMRDGEILMGACILQLAWGQLEIKYFFVEKDYRNQGVGKHLMERAFSYGKERGCTFAVVNTMNFQAPQFYEKLGCQMEFKREGYAHGVSFCYFT